MSYVSTMMESSAIIYRPTIGLEADGTPGRMSRRGITQDPFVPVDPTPGGTGGVATHRIATALPCSVQQAGPRDMILYGQRNAEFSTLIIFDRDPKCQMNDQLRATDRTGNVTYYLVSGAAIPVGRARQWIVTANFIQSPLYP